VIANVFVLNEKLYWYIFHCCTHFSNCTSTFLRVAPFFQNMQALFLNFTGTLSHQHLFLRTVHVHFAKHANFCNVLIHFSAGAQTEVFLQAGGATKGCAYIKILIESEWRLLQEAASFFSSGKNVSSLKTGNNHEQSKAPQAQEGICAF
jgi:hypothetical protein